MCDIINIINIICTLDLDEFPHTFIIVLGWGWGRWHALLLLLFHFLLMTETCFPQNVPEYCVGKRKNHTPHIQNLNIQTKIFNIKYRFK